jgi:hypothetical protein
MGPLAASGADFSSPGLILTVAAIPIMYVLSRQKLALFKSNTLGYCQPHLCAPKKTD